MIHKSNNLYALGNNLLEAKLKVWKYVVKLKLQKILASQNVFFLISVGLSEQVGSNSTGCLTNL